MIRKFIVLRALVLSSAAFLLFACGAAAAADAPAKKKVLYITTTTGFHHDACEYSVPVFQKMAEASGMLEVTASNKTDLITAEGLKAFDVVVFSNTTGGKGNFPLTEENGMALVNWVKGGKAFVGIHAATDTLADWKPYVDMIGGSFNGHPWTKKVKINIEQPLHPCAVHLPSPWYLDDEIYTYKNWSRDEVDVILSLDISDESEKGNREDRDYALAWCKPYGKGRVFYSALGHRLEEVWGDDNFQKHILGGVLWSLGLPQRETLRRIGLDFKSDPKADARAEYAVSLGHKKPGDWAKIFDGTTLSFGTDWEVSDDPAVSRGHWTVQPGGILQGDSRGSKESSSHLFYKKKMFRNFEYRAQVCINKEGNSGMYFRCAPQNLMENGRWRNWPLGYEAQVNNGWDPDPRKSGTFYPEPSIRAADLAKYLGYDKAKDDDNLWFTQHIIAVGGHFVIKLNGKVVVDAVDTFGHGPPGEVKVPDYEKNGFYSEGYFAYQMHHPGAVVKFRDIEVRELP